MLNLNFYQFSQRLIAKAEVLGKQVIRMSEAYTSKTVSWTGGVNDKLGSSKVVKSGTVRMDRDINGARGIFLKALVDSPSFLNERALSSNLAADLADLDQVQTDKNYRTTRESSNQYLPESNFIDPFDPTEQELAMFELLYGTESKDEYLKWMKAVIEFRKQQEHINEKQS